MNDHEIGRLAAAYNQLRPDWPLKQLTTLLSDDRMINRPRRDVAVVMAWVATEPGTANPYRVLENGPWWRAAAVEGQAPTRNNIPAHHRCSICSEPRDRCARIWAGDHTFQPDVRKPTEINVSRTVKAMRDDLHTPPATNASEDTP